jgi:predicted 3-demethylubiquinone-9 3-methyltransferase (glyoxalase superfamily)
MTVKQKIKTFLWFDNEAEKAVKHYMAAFKDAKIVNVERYGDAGPGRKGEVMLVEFTLAGQHFVALNGRPQFKPNEAVSLMVTAEDQAEVDRLWDHLLEGGAPMACGWLKDRWGFAWQIVPKRMFEMMADKDEARRNRAFAAMMQMVKFDVAALERAYRGA